MGMNREGNKTRTEKQCICQTDHHEWSNMQEVLQGVILRGVFARRLSGFNIKYIYIYIYL